MFNAIMVRKDEDGKTSAAVEELTDNDLPQGNVTVAIDYTTINYKDGLCLGSGGGLVRNYPHVPGIDFVGTVEASDDSRYQEGDSVLLTGWRVGEMHWGGFSQKARVNADWLVPLPQGLEKRHAMAIGTAGLAAMLAIIALENHGLAPAELPVLVTGAAGGVGSIATAVLAHLGHNVAAVTGRSETAQYLTGLGASSIVAREEVNEAIKKPMERAAWSGCVDAVGGEMAARVLGQLDYGASLAAVGNAGGLMVPANIIPFLLRGVNMLGIDSVMISYEDRIKAWNRLNTDLPKDKLEAMIQPAGLGDVIGLGRDILKGQVKGRVVVDVNQ